MSAALAVIMMLGTMIGMGASEAHKKAEQDKQQYAELEVVEEAPAPVAARKTVDPLIRDLDAIERDMKAQAPARVLTPTKPAVPSKTKSKGGRYAYPS